MKYYWINHMPCRCSREKRGWTEISQAQYNAYVETIRSFGLTPPEGKYYRLEADCTWQLYDLPASDPALTDAEALAIILGGDSV